ACPTPPPSGPRSRRWRTSSVPAAGCWSGRRAPSPWYGSWSRRPPRRRPAPTPTASSSPSPPPSALLEPGQQGDRLDLLVGQLVPADPSGRAPALRRPAFDDPLRRDDQVEADVVVGGGDRAGRQHLDLVDGRHHDGVGPDQAGLGGHGELEVGEPAALAEPGAVDAGGNRPG